MGRKSIIEKALDMNYKLSEQETRRILTKLNELKMIRIHAGRRGSEITTLGRKLVEDIGCDLYSRV